MRILILEDNADNGAAFGVANGSFVTVMDLLLAVNAGTRRGLLLDVDNSGSISNSERAFREMTMPTSNFRYRRFGGGKGGDEFVEDGGAVGLFGSQRPVGIMRIDHAKMSLVQM